MLTKINFVECIGAQLASRGFGAKRQAQILEQFHRHESIFKGHGHGPETSQFLAMNALFTDLAARTRERAKRLQKEVEVFAAFKSAVQEGGKLDVGRMTWDGGVGRGAGAARGAIAMIAQDARFGIQSWEATTHSYRGKYYQLLADGLEHYGKGFMGRQMNDGIGLYDIVREIMGRDTGNANAKIMAKAFGDMDGIAVADRNRAGGSLVGMENYFPQKQNAAKVAQVSFDVYKDDMSRAVDWNRTVWADGSTIPVSDRDRLLRVIYDTIHTGGASRIDPMTFRGSGHALGNKLDLHRFIHYKGPDEWIDIHTKYGEGSVIDVMFTHAEKMARDTALIDTFGPNPTLAMNNLKAVVRKTASDIQIAGKSARDRRAVAEAEKVLTHRFEPMAEMMLHHNPMDANSPFAAGVTATANIITSAKLGGAVLLAMPGDLAQTLAVRMANHMPLLSGMGRYLEGMTTDFQGAKSLALRTGFVFDTHVGSTYAAERFSPIATHGPAWSRYVSDTMIRSSGLTRHTEIARSTSQLEFMGMLHDSRAVKFEDLPFAHVMQRYGITSKMWDSVRNTVKDFTPEPNATFFRPLDILETNIVGKDELYKRFFTMVYQESLYMVPGATMEAASTLKLSSRPGTLPGAILHSFSMYKNFPVTFFQMYSRFAQANTGADRLKFTAAIIAGAVIIGALGTQMRELSKGRTPLPMNTSQFWGKALLSGGALSIWGDFLFTGVNQYGYGGALTAAGPLAQITADGMNAIMGDTFKFARAWDQDVEFDSVTMERVAQFAKSYTPGSSIWYSRLALERAVWDTLEEMANPDIHRKWRARVRKQEREFGNTFYSAPGEGLGSIGNIFGR